MLNKTGPKTEPCGTPLVTSLQDEEEPGVEDSDSPTCSQEGSRLSQRAEPCSNPHFALGKNKDSEVTSAAKPGYPWLCTERRGFWDQVPKRIMVSSENRVLWLTCSAVAQSPKPMKSFGAF